MVVVAVAAAGTADLFTLLALSPLALAATARMAARRQQGKFDAADAGWDERCQWPAPVQSCPLPSADGVLRMWLIGVVPASLAADVPGGWRCVLLRSNGAFVVSVDVLRYEYTVVITVLCCPESRSLPKNPVQDSTYHTGQYVCVTHLPASRDGSRHSTTGSSHACVYTPDHTEESFSVPLAGAPAVLCDACPRLMQVSLLWPA